MEDFEVTVFRGMRACPLIPRTTIGPRPFEDLEMTVLRGKRARPSIPRTSILVGPLKDLETSSECRAFANSIRKLRIPRKCSADEFWVIGS